jgi:hypothetical protein
VAVYADGQTFTVDSNSYRSSVSSPVTPPLVCAVLPPYSRPCSTACPAITLRYSGTSNAWATSSIASWPTVWYRYESSSSARRPSAFTCDRTRSDLCRPRAGARRRRQARGRCGRNERDYSSCPCRRLAVLRISSWRRREGRAIGAHLHISLFTCCCFRSSCSKYADRRGRQGRSLGAPRAELQ